MGKKKRIMNMVQAIIRSSIKSTAIQHLSLQRNFTAVLNNKQQWIITSVSAQEGSPVVATPRRCHYSTGCTGLGSSWRWRTCLHLHSSQRSHSAERRKKALECRDRSQGKQTESLRTRARRVGLCTRFFATPSARREE